MFSFGADEARVLWQPANLTQVPTENGCYTVARACMCFNLHVVYIKISLWRQQLNTEVVFLARPIIHVTNVQKTISNKRVHVTAWKTSDTSCRNTSVTEWNYLCIHTEHHVQTTQLQQLQLCSSKHWLQCNNKTDNKTGINYLFYLFI